MSWPRSIRSLACGDVRGGIAAAGRQAVTLTPAAPPASVPRIRRKPARPPALPKWCCHQGIRYVLAECLMRSGDAKTLKKLLKQYDEDASAIWLYTQALIAIRDSEVEEAEELAKKAWKVNSHVAAALAGTKEQKPSTNGYVGGEDEAAHYVDRWGFDWHTTPGAIKLLPRVAAEMASKKTEQRSVH